MGHCEALVGDDKSCVKWIDPFKNSSVWMELYVSNVVRHPCLMKYDAIVPPPASNNVGMGLKMQRGIRDLSSLTDFKHFSVFKIRGVMFQLLSGIKALHHAGVLHGDIKPSNIIIMEENPTEIRVKVSDFGLAQLLGEPLTHIVGSGHYRAPECADKSNSYDGAVDVFSWRESGCLLGPGTKTPSVEIATTANSCFIQALGPRFLSATGPLSLGGSTTRRV